MRYREKKFTYYVDPNVTASQFDTWLNDAGIGRRVEYMFIPGSDGLPSIVTIRFQRPNDHSLFKLKWA
jgi:hypothetical protein